jgi:hypothetical protein
MFLELIDKKLSTKGFKVKIVNNFLSIGDNSIKTLALDASRYDESNKLCFIFLWPIDDKTPPIKSLSWLRSANKILLAFLRMELFTVDLTKFDKLTFQA